MPRLRRRSKPCRMRDEGEEVDERVKSVKSGDGCHLQHLALFVVLVSGEPEPRRRGQHGARTASNRRNKQLLHQRAAATGPHGVVAVAIRINPAARLVARVPGAAARGAHRAPWRNQLLVAEGRQRMVEQERQRKIWLGGIAILAEGLYRTGLDSR